MKPVGKFRARVTPQMSLKVFSIARPVTSLPGEMSEGFAGEWGGGRVSFLAADNFDLHLLGIRIMLR